MKVSNIILFVYNITNVILPSSYRALAKHCTYESLRFDYGQVSCDPVIANQVHLSELVLIGVAEQELIFPIDLLWFLCFISSQLN